MYLVLLPGGRRHSAWDTKAQADHQKEVLEDHGYKPQWGEDLEVEFDPTVVCENGHYYV
ncbi:MAG: hypothetical protein Q7T05_02250 [Dehalococcoidia bacterium]|nr:hypothetical protein [Dehalococcoidia bacterium]